jgi:hypothetical protein
MGYELAGIDLTVAVSESHIRAADLSNLVGAVNSLYEPLAAVFLFQYDPLEKRLVKLTADSEAILRVTKLSSGSDISFSLLGIDKAIDAIRKLIDDIRFRKERRIQEEEHAKQQREKTAQARLKTEQMRLENYRTMFQAYREYQEMSPKDQNEFLRLINKAALVIEEDRNTLSP